MQQPQNEHEFFYVCNGDVLHGKEDLYRAVEQIDDGSLAHHFGENKNDFAAWVKNILKDGRLANSLGKARTRQELLRAIQKDLEKTNRPKTEKHGIISMIKEAFS